ncbi:ABC transporter substrate-binding protein [Xanthobacter variabilis]|uniref:ABC transporter substrate-binding protein n=1 Tax=Xanthobacter variabilis TaxID=3119932 RepID=UPI003727AE97
MIKKTFQTATLLAGLAAGLAFGSPAEAGQIRLGMTTWVGYGPLYLARDLGYFKEAGLDVELKTIEDAAIYMAAVASGDLDGMASTVDEVMKWRSPDFCFKSVLALDDSHGGDGVLAGKDVKSLKDLKGKEVALNEGSVSEFWFNILLDKAGMAEKDVQVTNMTSDDAAAAFIAGRVPAAVTWEPHLTEVRKSGKGQVLIDSTATPGAIVDTVGLKCDFIAANKADIAAFVNAYYKALDYMKANPEKSYEIMAKGVGGYLADPKEFADAAKGVNFYDKARNIEFFGNPQKGEAAELIQLANKIWGSKGMMKMKVDYDTLVDPSFATAQ